MCGAAADTIHHQFHHSVLFYTTTNTTATTNLYTFVTHMCSKINIRTFNFGASRFDRRAERGVL